MRYVDTSLRGQTSNPTWSKLFLTPIFIDRLANVESMENATYRYEDAILSHVSPRTYPSIMLAYPSQISKTGRTDLRPNPNTNCVGSGVFVSINLSGLKTSGSGA